VQCAVTNIRRWSLRFLEVILKLNLRESFLADLWLVQANFNHIRAILSQVLSLYLTLFLYQRPD